MKNGKRKPCAPPWCRDGRPDRWVTVGKFAVLMNRSPATVYNWISDGTLKEFGYSVYRDLKGILFIQISEEDRQGLDRILATKSPVRQHHTIAQ